jgi:hypothetical protein
MDAPSGYRNLGDIYHGKYVLVRDHNVDVDELEYRGEEIAIYEIVTRGDAQKIIDICKADGIPVRQGIIGGDFGPPHQRWPGQGTVSFFRSGKDKSPTLLAGTTFISIGHRNYRR